MSNFVLVCLVTAVILQFCPHNLVRDVIESRTCAAVNGKEDDHLDQLAGHAVGNVFRLVLHYVFANG